ncbi:MAG: 30S ribosome-binding factor RbfA [Pseudomonadota bacterium]|nr:30S ribosome-binding factor RbfA [Pseudomonadota bacterium]
MSHEIDRTRRIADLIKRELALIINRESHNARLRLLTITAVKVTRDYAIAKVYVAMLDESDLDTVLKELNTQSRTYRHLLAKQINMRTTPQLRFVYDETIAYSRKMSAILKDVTKDLKEKEQDEDE